MPRVAMPRVAMAAAAGLACLLAVVGVTGLSGQPVGAADNGDGRRLYCGAGLVADTADRRADWRGGVVLDFDRAAPCPDPVPSAALLLLRAAARGHPDTWSLLHLGWTYAVLAAMVTAVAVWAAGAAGAHRVLVLVPPVLPLLQSDFARFFVSTYAEPAGLLGGLSMLCGAGVVAVTRPEHRSERLVALGLLAGGGLLAGAAKLGYAPLPAMAVLVCAGTAVQLRRRWPGRRDRVTGPVVAGLLTVAAAGSLSAASHWQAESYGRVNTHNLVYTTVLPEVPGSARALGLPAAADDAAGEAYYPDGARGVPGAEVVAADPAGVRDRAWRVLLRDPAALARVVGVGLQATQGRSLDYLPSRPYTPGMVPTTLGTTVGAQGAEEDELRDWLDAMPHPWWPSLLAVLGVAAGGLAGLRRRSTLSAALARTGAVAAAAAVGVAVVAVLGDGYFEVARHVWLAAYLLDVTLWALVVAAGAAAVPAAQRVVVLARGRGWTRPAGPAAQ